MSDGFVNHPAAIFASTLGGTIHGFCQSITSGIIQEDPYIDMSAVITGLISSSIIIGGTVGTICGGFLSDKFGPKKVMLASSLIIMLCAIVQSVQNNVALLVTFRLISGIGVGIISIIAPIYASEQSSAEKRGTIVSLYQLFLTIGLTVAYSVNLLFNTVKNGWKYEFALTAFFPLIYFIGMCIVPESNRWVHKNKGSDSAPLLDSSSDNSNGREVINNNDKNVNSSEEKCTKSCGSSAKGLWKALMSSKRAFVTGIILAVFQQVTGINAVIMYSPSIIETLGLTEMRQKLIATIFVGVWNFISTFISTCLVDILGRVPLLAVGFGGMVLGSGLLVLSTLIPALQDTMYYLSLPAIAVYILGFELGPGPVYYVLVSELYPQQYRGSAMSVIAPFNWLSNIIITFCYPSLVDAMGVKWVFTIFCVLSVFVLVFIIVAVPETKGKSLEKITEDEASGDYSPLKTDDQ